MESSSLWLAIEQLVAAVLRATPIVLAPLSEPHAWANFFDSGPTRVATGVLAGAWGLRKLRKAIQNIRNLGRFPYAKSKNVTATIYCSANGAIFLLIPLLLLEPMIQLGLVFLEEGARYRHYVEAYVPVAGILSASILFLFGWVLIGVLTRVEFADRGGRLAYLGDRMKERGFASYEFLGIPPLALISNFGPGLFRMLA